MKYFAKIKYLGSNFCGFQVQPQMRTVQGELCKALSLAFGVPTKVTGCSRTDSGVHANEFCCTIENEGGTIPPDKLPVAVSRFLPNDLSLFYAENCDPEFHPRYDVVSKEYLYRVVNSPIYDPFYFGRAWFLPRKITEEGFKRMEKAAKHLLGKKDFSSFMSAGSDTEDTVREIFYIKIQRIGQEIDFYICADGFLYNMVRIIVGTLVECAFGRFEPDVFPNIIKSADRASSGMTAPAEGLYLNKVNY